MTRPVPSRLSRRVVRWALACSVLLLAGFSLLWSTTGPAWFDKPLSRTVLDRNGELLAGAVAADGQWRLPPASDSVADRFGTCLEQFEDRHFRSHCGIHLPSLFRALGQNIRSGHIVQGGSTITMQVARMSRGGPRTLWNKLAETWLALGMELQCSKDEIMALFAANAPFGGNVVGLEAACWRYLDHSSGDLSWAEAATLAVLPNAPGLVHPGRSREALRAKRDRLLDRLLEIEVLDSLEWSLARNEPLPEGPQALPLRAPHLLLRSEVSGSALRTTVDGALQDRVMAVAEQHGRRLLEDRIHNAAVLVMHVPTGEVLAYVGNLAAAGDAHAGSMDLVRAQRSTGSLLKPFLFAAMLEHGELLPDMLVADLPTQYEGFSPQNYDQKYRGAVPAAEALSRSFNVPAVRALRRHGVERTLGLLRDLGLFGLDRPAEHYGLSLILGGGESSLWELCGAYATLGRIRYAHGRTAWDGYPVVHAPVLCANAPRDRTAASVPLSAGPVHLTLDALTRSQRPAEEQGWQRFAGARNIAWKTGTSYGHRDAWAIGVSGTYCVGVWCGNASGEGRPGLTGALAAAPLLFEVFGVLPVGEMPEVPFDDLVQLTICRKSGHRSTAICPETDTTWVPRSGARTEPCPYHRLIPVSGDHKARLAVNEGGALMPWFVLPPAMESYYAPRDPSYVRLPPWRRPELNSADNDVMELIYPGPEAAVLLATELDGVRGRVVAEAAHRDRTTSIHWHLDRVFVATTHGDHRLALAVGPGTHHLHLTDTQGRSIGRSFQVSVPARP